MDKNKFEKYCDEHYLIYNTINGEFSTNKLYRNKEEAKEAMINFFIDENILQYTSGDYTKKLIKEHINRQSIWEDLEYDVNILTISDIKNGYYMEKDELEDKLLETFPEYQKLSNECLSQGGQ